MAKTKIAILGGGMAGLSAAYQLTRTSELRERHEVTVYQLGWRLGGKAASGRDRDGRNIEHGLHVWFGCYDNAFSMLRELYAARPPGGKLKAWQDAVKPQAYTPVGVLGDDGVWRYRPLTWPSNSGVPGDGTLLPTWGQIIETVLGWIKEFIERTGQPSPADALAKAGPPPTSVNPQPSSVLEAAREHLRAVGSRLDGQRRDHLDHLVELVRWARDAQAQAQKLTGRSPLEPQMIRDILDILLATMRGIIEDLIIPDRPLESLDDEDFRAWLIRHGADRDIVAKSTVVRVVYDTLFQYADGNVDRPSYAAGTSLGVIMRLVGSYKGAMMWDIQAGMGEVLVAPLYCRLLDAGVTFKFFRKVTSIEPAPREPLIQKIRMDVQAETTGDYDPIYKTADGYDVWPFEPLWKQLQNGEEMQKSKVNFESYWCNWPRAGEETLERGRDFDIAVLAISLGAYKQLNDQDPSMCAQLIPRSKRFADYVANVGVVPTQSVQLWCNGTSSELGWTTGKAATVSGPEYLNIWADMTQVIAFETWSDPPPLSLHYLTGTYKTTLYRQPRSNAKVPDIARDEIREQAIEWLNASSYAQWPSASSGGKFDFEVLQAASGAVGEARFDAQYWRANIDPTECCTLSAAGTTKYRLHPNETGFDNLILAGEGTRHGFNTTAIEGAIMSGAAASRTICGLPRKIVGYDFLQRRPSQGPG